MSGPQFFQTGMGRTFYEHTCPEILKTLQKINVSLAGIDKSLVVIVNKIDLEKYDERGILKC